MRDGFFRQEVLDARRSEPLGSIRLTPPRLGWWFGAVGLITIALTVLLLVFGSYTRHEAVEGTLVPKGGLLPVKAAGNGITVRTLCAVGTHVVAGQPLIEISGEQDSAALGGTRAAIVAQLKIKAARLESDIEDARHLHSIQDQDLRAHIHTLDTQLEQMNAQVALQKERAASAQALYEQFAHVGETGVVSKLQILQQRDAALASQTTLKEATRLDLDLKEQRAQLVGQLAALPATLRMRLSTIERELADVMQAQLEGEAQRATVLRAPADGVVTNLLVHAGQPVTTQQLLLDILPHDARLEAELWVPARAIGSIAPGNSVVLRYDAYPYQQFGQKSGHVREISRSALSPAELHAQLGREINEPRYRVLVDLDSQTIRANGSDEPLLPGAAVRGDVLFERRRLIEWIVQPLRALAQLSPGESEKEPRG